MTIPLIVAGAAISTVANAALSPIVNWANSQQTGEVLGWSQESLWRMPLVAPPPSAIFDLVNRRLINQNHAYRTLRHSGIYWVGTGNPAPEGYQGGERGRLFASAWECVRQGQYKKPGIEFVMGLWGKGYWSPNSAAASNAIEIAGGKPEDWRQYLSAMYTIPDVQTLLVMRNREYITDDVLEEKLKRQGFGFPADRLNLRKLRHASPGPQDLIHFAVKEAFSVDVANRVRLYDEYPEQIKPYLRDVGLDWEMNFRIISDGVERQATIGDMHWAAHWQPISPVQLYEMFHRFRANRINRYAAVGIPVTEFTLDDVERWLRINDYPPGVRSQLLGLSYTQLRLVDIRQALTLAWRLVNEPGFSEGIPQALRPRIARYNRQWGIEQFRDRGVLPDDAETQVDTVYALAAAALSAPARAASRSAVRASLRVILKGYQSGILERAVARTGLMQVGITTDAADTYLSIADANHQIERAAFAMRALRKGYTHGAIQGQEVVQRLLNAGLTQDRADEMLALWNSEFNVNLKQATTAKIVGWVAQGRMTTAEGTRRLENIGWDNPDIMLLIGDARGKSILLRAQAAKAVDVARRKSLRELQAAQKQAVANVKEIQAAIRKVLPLATLQRMLRKQLITMEQFLQRTVLMGYDLPTAKLYAADALKPNPKAIYPESSAKETTTKTEGQPQQPQQSPVVPPDQASPSQSTPTQTGQLGNVTQAAVLNTQPLVLNTQPDRLGGNGQST